MSKRIVFLGEDPVRSSPSLELGKAFLSMGYDVDFLKNLDFESTFLFIKKIKGAMSLIIVDYSLSLFRLRQLCLASLLGIPVIRWWVGTDVYNVLQNYKLQNISKKLSIFAYNIAVAQHLVEELKQVGISAMFIPSVVFEESSLEECIFGSKILVYMPTSRKEFYGINIIESLIQRFSELNFVVVADESHYLSKYSNVTSLGWVNKMSDIWPQIGCLLRITKHDGLPRMVLSALKRKKYVIYSWPLEGCWLAKDYNDCSLYLKKYMKFVYQKKENSDGPLAFKKIIGEIPPQERFLEVIKKMRFKSFYFSNWFKTLNLFLRIQRNIRGRDALF